MQIQDRVALGRLAIREVFVADIAVFINLLHACKMLDATHSNPNSTFPAL